jgi:hypothetical protein
VKKSLITAMLCCLTVTLGFTQEADTTSKFQIGANLSSLIQDESKPNLVLDYNFKTNNFFRLQVGFQNKSGNLETDLDATASQNNGLFGDTSITNSPYSSNDYSLQLGYYRTTKIDHKFSVYYGIDFIYQRNVDYHELNLKTRREFSQQQVQFFETREKITATTTGYGAAPMFGIQYQVSKRFQIGYEMHVSVISYDYVEDVNRSTVQTQSFSPQIFETTLHGTKAWNHVEDKFNPVSGLFVAFRL